MIKEATLESKQKPCANLLVLEDEDIVAEHIRSELELELQGLAVTISVAGNLSDARNAVRNECCDILLADCKVPEAPEAKRKVDACELMQEIKDAGYYLPRVGHTAYADSYELLQRHELVDYAVSKKETDSTERVIRRTVQLTTELIELRTSLWKGLNLLKWAAAQEDIIERQGALDQARQAFASISIPKTAPEGFQNAILWLVGFVMRVSAVGSDTFGLAELDVSALPPIESLVARLNKATFSYDKDAMPAMMKLETLGFPAIMRISI